MSYLLIDPLLNALNALPALDGLGQRLARLLRNMFGEPYTTWVADRVRETNPGAVLGAHLFSGVGETTVMVLTTIVLTFFLLLSGNLFLQKLVRVLPRIRDKVKAVKVVHAVQEDVGRYFATVTLINIVVGTIAGGIAWYWELPAPLLLAVLVALFNYVPYLGAIANVLLLLLASGAAYTDFGEILRGTGRLLRRGRARRQHHHAVDRGSPDTVERRHRRLRPGLLGVGLGHRRHGAGNPAVARRQGLRHAYRAVGARQRIHGALTPPAGPQGSIVAHGPSHGGPNEKSSAGARQS